MFCVSATLTVADAPGASETVLWPSWTVRAAGQVPYGEVEGLGVGARVGQGDGKRLSVAGLLVNLVG